MKWAYCRGSTSAERQLLDRQIRFAKLNGVKDENIFKEFSSGGKIDRVEFNRLLTIVKNSDEESKELIFSSVDRATRSLKQLIDLVQYAKDNKVKLVFGDFIIDCRNTLSALTEGQLLMLGLVAELTRLIIVENVKDGLVTAREERGRIGGQPKLTKERLYEKNPDFFKYYAQYKNKQITLKELTLLSQVCKNTVYNYIKIIEN